MRLSVRVTVSAVLTLAIGQLLNVPLVLWAVLTAVIVTQTSVGQSLNKDSIGAIVKRLVRRARLAHPEEYGGHSLRAGFITEASANGATDRQIMRQTGP